MTQPSPSIPEGMRIIHVSSAYAMAEFDRCLVTVWKLQPTKEAFDARHEALLDLSARHKGKCAYVELIESTSKPPPDELRKVAVETFKRLGSDVACVGFVLDGPEMRSAINRAILTTMMFLLPQMQPTKVFKRLTDMAQWVRSKIEHPQAFESRLVGAFDYLRKASPST
jgi:hypothetical protein